MTVPTPLSGEDAGHTWPDLLTALVGGSDLSSEQSAWAMDRVMSGEASPAQLAAFLAALRSKGETVEEMSGLSAKMLEHALSFTCLSLIHI